MADDENTEDGEEQPKKSKLPIIIIAVVLLLVLLGVGGFLMMSGGGEEEVAEGEAVEDDSEPAYETVKLDPMVVNLSQNTSFLKTVIVLEYDPSVVISASLLGDEGGGGGGGTLPGALGSREPMIFDAMLRVIGTKRASQVLSADGKEALKEELVEAINEASNLDEAAVVNAYFTEFIVQ